MKALSINVTSLLTNTKASKWLRFTHEYATSKSHRIPTLKCLLRGLVQCYFLTNHNGWTMHNKLFLLGIIRNEAHEYHLMCVFNVRRSIFWFYFLQITSPEPQLAIRSSCNSHYCTQTCYVYLKLIYMEKLPDLTQINRHDSIIESGFWSTKLVWDYFKY